uniref:DIX domain-containing protein n=1 Tax=Salarias fasciatus TaxID=181472 RepID=A0A672I6D5_SALFA
MPCRSSLTRLFPASSRCSTLSRRPLKASDEGVTSPRLPLVATDRSQNVWQWILESERQGKHKPHSPTHLTPNPRPAGPTPPGAEAASATGFTSAAITPATRSSRTPAMPPLPPPNTLAQLEEACRRLEEVSKPPKQSCLQRDRSHPTAAFPPGCSSLASPGLQTDESKELVVTYFFCGEEIPYRSMMKTHCLTLGHFKEQLSKKGNYRRRGCDEFECGAVFEEVWEDAAVLPCMRAKSWARWRGWD